MKDQRLEVSDIVRNIDDATRGTLNIPEFQRKFVWKPSQVRDLVDSLWRDYPIGMFLLWESEYTSAKTALGGPPNRMWVVDGQQRITALSLLFGRKPYWWPEAQAWNRYFDKYDVMVNVTSPKDSLNFALPNPVRRKSAMWVSVRKILTSGDLSQLASRILKRLEWDQTHFNEIHERLQSVKRVSERHIYAIIVNHEIEDVAEIFSRLNMAGTKIKESDVALALIAAKQEGWVRMEFDPFITALEERGFSLAPGVLVRSLTGIGRGATRLKDVPSAFWESSSDFDYAWTKTKRSIRDVIKFLQGYGLLSSDLIPSRNALIPLFILYDRFKTSGFSMRRALYWFLMANWDGRYSGSAITVLWQDVRTVKESETFDAAIETLLDQLRVQTSLNAEDFLAQYGKSKFLRLLLCLMVFKREAKDWIYQEVRIGHEKGKNILNEGFRPEWHHFVPRGLLLKKGVESSEADALANIVILNERANRKFRSYPPEVYLKEYDVSNKRLEEQLVPLQPGLWKVEKYGEFLKKRSKLLSSEANRFLRYLAAD